MNKNYYQILGISRDATQEEIKKAYRLYASKFHPDKHKGDEFFSNQFKSVKEAFDILSNPIYRKKYDHEFFSNYTENQSPFVHEDKNYEEEFSQNNTSSSSKQSEGRSSSSSYNNTKLYEYAGFWRRSVAYIVDIIFISIFEIFIFALMFIPLIFVEKVTFNEIIEGVYLLYTAESILSYMLTFILTWFYFSFMESTDLQATFGKYLFRIKVIDYNGNRIKFGRASARFFGKAASMLILGIGFLMIIFTKKKQGLHDLWANCLLIIR